MDRSVRLTVKGNSYLNNEEDTKELLKRSRKEIKPRKIHQSLSYHPTRWSSHPENEMNRLVTA